MDRQTLMLELKGLSRVVDANLRQLIIKRRIVAELADTYEPENPFLHLLDEIEGTLTETMQRNTFEKLSGEERKAFAADWLKMRPDQQLRYLDEYIGAST